MLNTERRTPIRCTLASIALVVSLVPPGVARAQELREVIVGSVGDIPTDEFGCGEKVKGGQPCGLSYRYYCVDVPSEINSPALPLSGFPIYKPQKRLYLAHAAHTGNFPEATALGPGRVWNLVWDGVKGEDTPGHVGYHAAQSQVVLAGEMGNPMTPTCLPVTGQFACFGQVTSSVAARIQNTPQGPLSPIGGLSPTPVPLVARNGIDAVSFTWDQAVAQVTRDGADLPILGYRLYLYPNPATAPNEKQLRDAAVPVGEVIPAQTTRLEVKRSDPAFRGSVTTLAAMRVAYKGGLESTFFSANGPATGLAFPDAAATREMDDAKAGAGGVGRAIDIEDLFLEIREEGEGPRPGPRFLFATVNLIGDPDGKLREGTRVKVYLDFGEEGLGDATAEPGKKSTQDFTLEAVIGKSGDSGVKADFSGIEGLGKHSRYDASSGQVLFAVPLETLNAAAGNDKLRASDQGGGRRRLLVWAEAGLGGDLDRAPNTNDRGAPTVAGEVVHFTF